MIDILGKKRTTIMIVLATLNAVIGYGWYVEMRQGITDLERNYKSVNAEITNKRKSLYKLEDEWANINSQIDRFKNVESSGLLDEPDLSLSSEILNEHVNDSGILSAKVNYSNAVVVPSEKARRIGYVILNKPIEVNIENAFEDADVYNLVHKVQEQFPGSVSFKSLLIKNKGDLTVAKLQNISRGNPEGLISASYVFDWHSLIKKDKLSEEWLGNQK